MGFVGIMLTIHELFHKERYHSNRKTLTPGVKSVSCKKVKKALRFADEEDGFPVGV